jgi:hypothetical protein
MISAKDLMIGDFITAFGTIRIVTGISCYESINGGEKFEMLTTMWPGHTYPDSYLSFRTEYAFPIEITKEFLELNGFHYNENQEWYEKGIILLSEDCGTWVLGKLGVGFHGDQLNYFNDVTYIHELHNVMRVLGEKELIIK